MFDMIREKTDIVKVMDALFVGMARCAYLAQGEPVDEITIEAMRGWLREESVTGDPLQFIRNRDAILQELNDGFRIEYNGKNKPTDKYSRAV